MVPDGSTLFKKVPRLSFLLCPIVPIVVQKNSRWFNIVPHCSKWFNGGSAMVPGKVSSLGVGGQVGSVVVIICKTGKDSIFLHSLTDTEL